MGLILQPILFTAIAVILGFLIGWYLPKVSSKGRAWAFFIGGIVVALHSLVYMWAEVLWNIDNHRVGAFRRGWRIFWGGFKNGLRETLHKTTYEVVPMDFTWPLDDGEWSVLVFVFVAFILIGHAASYFDNSRSPLDS